MKIYNCFPFTLVDSAADDTSDALYSLQILRQNISIKDVLDSDQSGNQTTSYTNI